MFSGTLRSRPVFQMWSTLHLGELQNIIKLDFLGRTGLWQWKTNQDLETGLKIALKHANRPDLVSKSPICLLPPSFLLSLYHILYFGSSSSLGLIGMSNSCTSSGIPQHRPDLAWDSQAPALEQATTGHRSMQEG